MPIELHDPFAADDGFTSIDLRREPEALLDDLSNIADEHPEFAPTPEEVLAADGPLEPEPIVEPEAVVEPVQPAAPEPEVHEYPDGTVVTIEKTTKGWQASLDAGTGGPPEVFKGRTKDEMFLELAVGKANATRKIRDQNRKEKLRVAPTPAPAPVANQPRVLSADDIFQIKTQLQADPNLAMETWFQKRTGMSIDELNEVRADARAGKSAANELDIDAVGRAFVANHPDYQPDDANLRTIFSWLGKYKLNPPRDLSELPENEASSAVYAGGAWTVPNLDEAFEDLSAGGFLVLKPEDSEEPAVEPVPVLRQAPAAPPVAPNPRIVSTRRQPRAGLGIRPSATSTVPAPETDRPPTAEEMENMSDDEINAVLASIRRERARSARR